MKKTTFAAVGIVVVLVAAYAGATASSGHETEARHREYIERAQAQAPFLKLAEQSYREGFASASSSSTFEIGCVTADGKAPPRPARSRSVERQTVLHSRGSEWTEDARREGVKECRSGRGYQSLDSASWAATTDPQQPLDFFIFDARKPTLDTRDVSGGLARAKRARG